MMIDIDELDNRIHADVFDVAKTGIPLGVFPNVFQKIAFELVNYENFNLEYTVAIMLSAFATAIGNTYHVRIKGKWVTACFLYMILVGRPGLGKTPPLGFLYFPIRDYDQRLLEQARKEYEASSDRTQLCEEIWNVSSPKVNYYWRDGTFDALEELRTRELNHRTYGYGRGL